MKDIETRCRHRRSARRSAELLQPIALKSLLPPDSSVLVGGTAVMRATRSTLEATLAPFAIIFIVLAFFAGELLSPGSDLVANVVAGIGLPVAIALAIARYHLSDINQLIGSRKDSR